MKFFNPKEEVLDIQLTQQGKRLLSMGKFMPKYYAFYDDDILYDSSYAGTIPRTATAAGSATITFSDSDDGESIGYNQTITIISTDGTSVTYTTKADEDTDEGEFDADGGFDDKATSLKACIEAGDHASKITVSQGGAGNNVLTLTQATAGRSGNTTITENINDCTVTNFTGGADGSSGEHQNSAEKRIKEETPRLHAQYTFTGLQEQVTKLTNNEADLNNGSVDIQPTAEKMYCLGEPLGNVPPGIKHAPAWEVQYLRGRLSGSTEFTTGSYHQPIRIPQLSSSIEYKTYVTFMTADGQGLERDYLENRKYKGNTAAGELGGIDYTDEELAAEEIPMTAGPYEDGSVLQVEEDHLLLHVLEHNTEFLKENFDVEIYMNEGNAVNEKNEQYPIYKQLYFAREDEPITPNHVEYWFEYAFDEGVLDEIICDSDLDLSKRNNMLTDIEITCEERGTPGARNIYDVDVEEPEEPC